ncbi:ClbS/DfsB family four-helix bundle protein [Shimia litoralis]|uniref:ClbS/DfsB family four-helix bundle protein n=1 Tax=Shimia litoralis TaxID=420403 RepID=A0A4V6F3C5_9RHOB|nr:ClbS/DfsB family four-helix bundle protein [Shimia litoralis]TKZ22091.1 ClbS/DfsB family four-helix bundle protein [Shimia litoralis]
MPAATTKAGLLAVSEKEFAKLQKVLAGVGSDLADVPFDDGWSIKDVVVHRAHWIALFLGWYADGQAGKDVAFPAPGYKWNQLKSYNAELRVRHATLGWNDACAQLEQAHAQWSNLVSSLDEGALYGGPMQGANNAWTTGRWAEAAGPSHYRSAAKFVRACLRANL